MPGPGVNHANKGASWMCKKCWIRWDRVSLARISVHGAWYQVKKKGLARGDPGINRLDRIAKQHDIDYSRARHLKDKHKAVRAMIAQINKLPGRKTKTECIVKKIIQAKVKLGV